MDRTVHSRLQVHFSIREMCHLSVAHDLKEIKENQCLFLIEKTLITALIFE